MTATYAEFIAHRAQDDGYYGFNADFMPDYLFDFQRALVDWAVRKGRAAIFADCGTGKTPMQLVWAENVRRRTGKPVLVSCPLAVAAQTATEAEKFGIEAAVSRDGSVAAPVTITNYERLHLFDSSRFAGMVCDESSAIKAFDSERRGLVTAFMRKLPYRLLCTATAAPNDYIELGTSSEALGALGYMDMLGRFFTNKQKSSKGVRAWGDTEWRFKGHAEEPFWRWVSSWARAMRFPSDLGFSDDGFVLPPLNYRQHVVTVETPAEDRLFDVPAVGMDEERSELRRSITERCEMAADLLADADYGVAWCHLNAEGDLLAKLIDGAEQISGADTLERKEDILLAFGRGDVRVVVTKPKIGAWGLNWTHCNRMTFFPSHSYEQFYQAVRRCWRFRQERPVTVDLITTEGGHRALANLQRKASQADRMFAELVAHMNDALQIERTTDYEGEVSVPAWL